MSVQIASYSILRADPGESYAVVVWGSRTGVERAWARIPSYWTSDTDSSTARGAWIGAASLVAGIVPLVIGTITGATGVPSTPPTPIAPTDVGRFEGARAGQWYCVFFGSPARGSTHGSGQMLADDMKWDLNGVGATDIRFAIVSPTSQYGSQGDRTNEALATRRSVRQTWTDTVERGSETISQVVNNASDTAENASGLLKSLTNPWVLIPVALGVVAVTALFVVVPAVLQVKVNR